MIASRAVSQIPREYISGTNESNTSYKRERETDRKIRRHTDVIADNIIGTLEGYNTELVEYLSDALIRSNSINICNREDTKSRASIDFNKLSAFLAKSVNDWKNVPLPPKLSS